MGTDQQVWAGREATPAWVVLKFFANYRERLKPRVSIRTAMTIRLMTMNIPVASGNALGDIGFQGQRTATAAEQPRSVQTAICRQTFIIARTIAP